MTVWKFVGTKNENIQTGEGYKVISSTIRGGILQFRGGLLMQFNRAPWGEGLLEVMKLQSVKRSVVAGWIMVRGYQRVDGVLRAASLGSLGWSVAGCRGAQAGGWLIGWFVCGEADTQLTVGNNLAANAEFILNQGGRVVTGVCVQLLPSRETTPQPKSHLWNSQAEFHTKHEKSPYQNHDSIIQFTLCPSFFLLSHLMFISSSCTTKSTLH